MEYVKLQGGVRLPMVGFGTYPLNGDELKKTVQAALLCGYELFDTATAYGNEAVLGEVLKSNRQEVTISSKCSHSALRGRKRYLYLDKKSLSYAYKKSCDRLGSAADIYLIHAPFKGCAKYYQELMDLQQKGMVRAIGVCNFNIDELKQLHDKVGVWPEVNQTEISVYNTDESLVNFCQDHNICVEGYSPFGRGNLVCEILNNEVLIDIASQCSRTVGQVVIRWVVQRGVVCIVRSTSPCRMADNINVFDFTLSESQMKAISQLNTNRVFGVNQINKKTISW